MDLGQGKLRRNRINTLYNGNSVLHLFTTILVSGYSVMCILQLCVLQSQPLFVKYCMNMSLILFANGCFNALDVEKSKNT